MPSQVWPGPTRFMVQTLQVSIHQIIALETPPTQQTCHIVQKKVICKFLFKLLYEKTDRKVT